jgi:regulatory protein
VGVVTAIIPEARREGRLAILVDGQPAGIVSLDDIERLNLRVGATADPAALAEADAECALYDRALRLLAARSRSAAEIRRRLRRDGAALDRIERVIGALESRGLVDDAAHARAVTRSRVRSRAASSRRIEQELRRQGVAADVAAEAIGEVFADESVDEAAVAMEVARKRAALLVDLPAPVQRRRLYGYLARRGYSPDIVRAAVDRYIRSYADDDHRRDP